MTKRSHVASILLLGLLVGGCAATQSRDEILRRGELIRERYQKTEAVSVVTEEDPPLVFTAIESEEPSSEIPTDTPPAATAGPTPPQVKLRPVKKERLIFKAKYLGMTVADLTTEVKERKIYKGIPVIVFEATGRTMPPFSKVFKVEDIFVSYMDEQRKRVVYLEENRSEGKYRKHSFVEFDYDKGLAYFYNDVNKTRKEIPISDQVHDPVTAIYYVRTLAWQPGDTIDLQVYASEKIYDLICLIADVKALKTPNHGKRKTLVLQPYAYINGVDAKKGRAKGYFDPGRARIPLKAVIKTPFFGSAQLILERIENQTFSAQ